jgi:hypothetical protein
MMRKDENRILQAIDLTVAQFADRSLGRGGSDGNRRLLRRSVVVNAASATLTSKAQPYFTFAKTTRSVTDRDYRSAGRPFRR